MLSEHIHPLLDNVVEELKDFVLVEEYQKQIKFDVKKDCLEVSISFEHSEDPLVLKFLDAIMKSAENIKNCAFRLMTDPYDQNPILRSYSKRNKLPRCCETENSFNSRLFFHDGNTYFARSLNYADNAVYPFEPELCILEEAVSRSFKMKLKNTRNLLYGQHRLSLNVPDQVAFLIKERPELLSYAIRQNNSEVEEELIETLPWFDNRTMVKTLVVDKDYQKLNPIECIDSPTDSISERAAWALFKVLEGSKFSNISQKIDPKESFEDERKRFIKDVLMGRKPNTLNALSRAFLLITETDKAGCKKILLTSTDSDVDERTKPKLKKKYKKRLPEEIKTKSWSKQVNNGFTSVAGIPELDERLNYAEGIASDEDSLGDDEEIDFLSRKSNKKVLSRDNEKDLKILQTAMESAELEENERAWEELQPSAAPLAELIYLEDYEDL
ncbi:unnamed protein product [Auanema sp. JU1783]|nr:unnamed protein product [Auanema sp. JU1783]